MLAEVARDEQVVVAAQLLRRAREHHPQTFLRVHPDNAPALRCYAAAGFAPVDPALQAEWNAPQPVAYVWLTVDEHGSVL